MRVYLAVVVAALAMAQNFQAAESTTTLLGLILYGEPEAVGVEVCEVSTGVCTRHQKSMPFPGSGQSYGLSPHGDFIYFGASSTNGWVGSIDPTSLEVAVTPIPHDFVSRVDGVQAGDDGVYLLASTTIGKPSGPHALYRLPYGSTAAPTTVADLALVQAPAASKAFDHAAQAWYFQDGGEGGGLVCLALRNGTAALVIKSVKGKVVGLGVVPGEEIVYALTVAPRGEDSYFSITKFNMTAGTQTELVAFPKWVQIFTSTTTYDPEAGVMWVQVTSPNYYPLLFGYDCVNNKTAHSVEVKTSAMFTQWVWNR
jgi:hypothetical protein